MSELPPEFVSEMDASFWETRENIKDYDRELSNPDDSPVQKAARKYLKSRSRRRRIEEESGSKIDAFPYRLIETIRAHRLANLGEFEFASKEDRDHWLPTFARTLVDKSPDLPGSK